jgi:hypothetical protein
METTTGRGHASTRRQQARHSDRPDSHVTRHIPERGNRHQRLMVDSKTTAFRSRLKWATNGQFPPALQKASLRCLPACSLNTQPRVPLPFESDRSIPTSSSPLFLPPSPIPPPSPSEVSVVRQCKTKKQDSVSGKHDRWIALVARFQQDRTG